MRGMILAAGIGTRLLPITERIPKCMVDVAGKPLIYHQLQWFKANGINEVAINLFHLPEPITSYVGDGSRFGVRVTYSPEKEILGTAGGVKAMAHFFQGTFVVFYGDNFTDLCIDQMLIFHRKNRAAATLFIKPVGSKISSIIQMNSTQKIVRFVEKPSPDEVRSVSGTLYSSNGIYILEPKILEFIPFGTMFDFGKDLFPNLIDREAIYGFLEPKAFWRELGTLERYTTGKKDIEEILQQRSAQVVP